MRSMIPHPGCPAWDWLRSLSRAAEYEQIDDIRGRQRRLRCVGRAQPIDVSSQEHVNRVLLDFRIDGQIHSRLNPVWIDEIKRTWLQYVPVSAEYHITARYVDAAEKRRFR